MARPMRRGSLFCDVAPGVSGEVLVRAETRDARRQNVAGATTSIWVAGEDDWWFGGTQGDRMDVCRRKRNTSPARRRGSRCACRSAQRPRSSPSSAKACCRSFVTQLAGESPVDRGADRRRLRAERLRLGARGARTCRRKRVRRREAAASEEVTALVDLNKPAYRLGMAEINVGWQPHRLNVSVTPDRSDVSRSRAGEGATCTWARRRRRAARRAPRSRSPRSTKRCSSSRRTAAGTCSTAMMGERGIEVWTSTAQMQVVGKRHYGRKAVPHGGGGGRERDARASSSTRCCCGRRACRSMRRASATSHDAAERFADVVPHRRGRARRERDLFGTGAASIATTQDLILLSGLPPLVREGDRFAATFTVRNTTDAPLPVDVTGASVDDCDRTPSLQSQRVEIPRGSGARRRAGDVDGAGRRRAACTGRSRAKAAAAAAGDTIKLAQTRDRRRIRCASIRRRSRSSTAAAVDPRRAPAGRGAGPRRARGDAARAARRRARRRARVHELLSVHLPRAAAVARGRAARRRRCGTVDASACPPTSIRDGLLKYFPIRSARRARTR